MASKTKKEPRIVIGEPDTENHMQLFRRLSDPIFNTGAMHGTPGQKKGKSN